MTDWAINVRGLGKRYRLGSGGGTRGTYRTLRESITGLAAAPFRGRRRAAADDSEFWALRDVSFDVRRGEVVGLIGRNGAGKSTLLKVVSRITEPTAGSVELEGRVGSLLEVGTGFHPELSGRENIFLNGAILGMTRAEIVRRFDEIVAFGEVDRFLDTPVKRYSSGMYMRLAFSVAAHLESEILLVDEVLAVGDSAFQRKCLDKMRQVGRQGRTVLFVSHNLGAVLALCDRAVTLEYGRVLSDGPAEEQVQAYLSRLAESSKVPLADRTDREGNGTARLTDVGFATADGRELEHALSGEPLAVNIGYRTERVGVPIGFALSCYSPNGEKIFHVDNAMSGGTLAPAGASGEVTCLFPKLPLPPGHYQINIGLNLDGHLADHLYAAALLEVIPGDFFNTGRLASAAGGLVFVEHDWSDSRRAGTPAGRT